MLSLVNLQVPSRRQTFDQSTKVKKKMFRRYHLQGCNQCLSKLRNSTFNILISPWDFRDYLFSFRILFYFLARTVVVNKWVPAICWGNLTKLRGSDLRWTSIPSRGSRNTSSRFMLQKPG